MTRPKLRERMPSMTSRVMLKTESRLVWITASQFSLVMRWSMAVARDAGVVDEDVDGPEVAGDTRHALLAGGVVADVALVDGDARLGLELARGGIVAGVVGRHAAALVLEGNGDGVADAARTSGDDRNPCHFLFPPIQPVEQIVLIEALRFIMERESCSRAHAQSRMHASAPTLRSRQSRSIRSDPALG